MRKVGKVLKLLALCAPMMAAPLVAGAEYPEKPIRFVSGFGPGSSTDVIGRLVGQGMSERLGQPVVMENRPGALSTIATEVVSRAEPDGYTVLVGANSGMSTGPAGLVENVRYDPIKDFVPIGTMVQAPFILMVNPAIDVSNVQELVAYLKQNPDKAHCAAGNANGRVFCELFKGKVDVAVTTVMYKSTPAAATDLMGGQVAMMFLDLPGALPRITGKQLRPLAIMNTRRAQAIADVPTADEAGLAGIPSNFGWVALFAPARVPEAIVSRLNQALNAVLSTEETRGKFEEMGFEVVTGPPSNLAELLSNDLQSWKKLLKELNISPEG